MQKEKLFARPCWPDLIIILLISVSKENEVEKRFFSGKKNFGEEFFFLCCAKSKVQVIVFRCFDLPLSIRETVVVDVDNDGDVTSDSNDTRSNDDVGRTFYSGDDAKIPGCQSKGLASKLSSM